MLNNKSLGILGEKEAVKYLKKHKYKILETNYTCHIGEIDIVARDGPFLCFVEVKARSSLRYGYPKEAVDECKQHKLVLLAQYYQKMHRLLDDPIRFDVVQILDGEIELIKGGFEAF